MTRTKRRDVFRILGYVFRIVAALMLFYMANEERRPQHKAMLVTVSGLIIASMLHDYSTKDFVTR
jgi:hypothetical protein